MEWAALCLQESGPGWKRSELGWNCGSKWQPPWAEGKGGGAALLMQGHNWAQSYTKVIEGEGEGPEAVLPGQVI